MIDYNIFGLRQDAPAEEIENAYIILRKKYREKMLTAGEPGAEAARSLERLNVEYKKFKQENVGNLTNVEELVKGNELEAAQDILDATTSRTAEWHFMQALVYYKKNWFSECRKQLEIAIGMDPANQRYKENYLSLLAYSEIMEQKRKMETVQEDERQGGDCCRGNNGSCTKPCISDCCFRDKDN
jgi:hypothetical protein